MNAADQERRVEAIFNKLGLGEMTVGQAADQLALYFVQAPIPREVVNEVLAASSPLNNRRVSVRSSATCEDSASSAWAGQLDTYLDVKPEDIVERLRDCWLSIFKGSALAYGAYHGYGPGHVRVAVVIQEMVASDVSGIGFSVHPVTQEPDFMLIEACLGLGEAIVSGKIVPDQYVIERSTGAILDRSVGAQRSGLFLERGGSKANWRNLDERGSKPKLSDEQVLEYSNLLSRIQDHYGFPVDTEWAFQDGQFWLLQARPITTLAEEYKGSIIDTAEDWEFAVRRPMSLMEVSLWSHWLDSEHGAARIGIETKRALSIQDEAGMANDFIAKQARDSLLQHVVHLFQHDRPQLLEILQYGQNLYRDSEIRIQRGSRDFRDLDEAADFMARVAQYTTTFPVFVLHASQQEGCQDPEVISLAEGLPAHTLYPAIERYIIDPLAVQATKALGFSEPEEAPTVATWSELRQGSLDRDILEWRLEAVRNGRRFVFQSIEGEDQVRFLSQTAYLLMRLANQRKMVRQENPNELIGQAAWPGIHRGRARVVLSPDAVGQTIKDGEVLISIQSSPALMPLLKHCGAIVTDEGGIACHAAIISRELRKPTLIGTKSATSLIHTGDIVEVDTYAQVIRIIERSKER
jgi:phosphohistidine swiveling domain-containing protein